MTQYIFQRPSSNNWWIKLRSPSGRIERSLGTSDRREAEIAALPFIRNHKAALLAARPRVETTWERQFEPGLHTGLNGERIYATATELHYLDETPVLIEPNGVMVRRLIARGPLSADQEFGLFAEALGEAPPRPVLPVKDGDDAIMQTYLEDRNIAGQKRREAEATWALYKELIGKPLKDAKREDGRKLVKHILDQGNKTATVAKKIGWLRAAVEVAISDGLMTFNPFSKVMPKGDNDELKRKPLSDADMQLCKRNLGNLSASDQLLFRFLATTGARLGEAFQINGEQIERGIRYVMIGSKTEASQRRLPLPADLLPHLPKKIVGPLFAAEPSIELAVKATSRRINKFLDDCGLTDRSLVVHSLRHRAADRLRAYECPPDIRRAILGHEDGSISEGYGEGFSVKKLRKWIDKIGF